ncbi:lytic murein transglycosylase B [Alkalilimnicola sp. S0819]|uniref:lytic murein transglycosylase B n=1 Tax=Alkalilimnicola sp. S0819 TaxID=2613922 RepID=UPI00126161A1|nr:lytic murein transglycosylase B [Alkalilimnicola sp. S0819]KAB7623768.1 lytic murein transglycosylase B [Alkalilimnicola sp. S0819]MPQ16640.1 lytic murein transglycosylase B [Alkalilimnicola sp. S0819]
MPLSASRFLLCLALLPGVPLAAQAATSERAEVRSFIEQLSEAHGFTESELEEVLDQAQPRPEIIEAISRPAEALPWYRYRPIFMKPERIRLGVEFWREHEALLAEARTRYGVPEEIIIAILGVETRYGTYKGRHRVIDALLTLGFDYPPRADFFRKELGEFLLLAREQGMDPLTPMGSYAGAMGLPQFISSSYRHYAVDFDGDGRTQLWEIPDAIGSVANYFRAHGWRAGEPVALPARLTGDAWEAYAQRGRRPVKPATALETLRAAGVSVDAELSGDTPATLRVLALENGEQPWVVLHNFYVITRYNHSPLYAMAVWQLAEAIREQKEQAR